MPREPYTLKPNVYPVLARPFPVPQKHLIVLRQAYDSEWAANSLGIPKSTTQFALCQTLQVQTNLLRDILSHCLAFKKQFLQ